MTHILKFFTYILKHSSGLDTVEYLSNIHHQGDYIEKKHDDF